MANDTSGSGGPSTDAEGAGDQPRSADPAVRTPPGGWHEAPAWTDTTADNVPRADPAAAAAYRAAHSQQQPAPAPGSPWNHDRNGISSSGGFPARRRLAPGERDENGSVSYDGGPGMDAGGPYGSASRQHSGGAASTGPQPHQTGEQPTVQQSGPGQYQAGPAQPGQHQAGPQQQVGPGQHQTGPQHGGYVGTPPSGMRPAGAYPQGPGGTGPQQYGGPFGAPGGYPPPPPPGLPAPDRSGSGGGRRVGLGALVAVAVVTALVAGAVGGVTGAQLSGATADSAPAAAPAVGEGGSLAEPIPPDVDATPLGPVEAVAERVLPSLVQLFVQGGGQAGEGSGMVLSGDGLILTNNHVVEIAASGGAVLAVFRDGTTAPAQIVGRDPSSDLAVIQAQGVSGLTAIELGNSDAVRVGQQVVAFGSPLGLGGTVTTGIISAVDRAVSVGADSGASEATVLDALQTDAAINPGNSGGPLTDMQGRVVGINSVIATTGQQGGSIGVGFAVPSNQARRIAEELRDTGQATHAVLGVQLQTDGGFSFSGGATVAAVTPGGPAAAAGMLVGDVITQVDDRRVSGADELIAAIGSYAPGSPVTITASGREVPVTLGSQPG